MANTLSSSPADIARALLIAVGAASDPATQASGAKRVDPWPIFVEGEPSSPDNVFTIYDTQGQDDGRSMLDGELFYHYGIQLRVRSYDHRSGWLRADAMRKVMAEGVYGVSVTIDVISYLVWCFAKIGPVLPIGKEPSTKRSLFTINALLSVRQLP